MRQIDQHTIKILEFFRIKEIISGLTLSPEGRTNVSNLHPIYDTNEIRLRLRRSAQMRDIIRFQEAMPLSEMGDITEFIGKAKVDGMRLDPKSLLKIKLFVDTVSDLKKYGRAEKRSEQFPDICELLARFRAHNEISEAISKAIDSAGEVLDKASSNLFRIRRERGDTESRIRQQLNKILASRQKHAGWQDDVITVRDGRYVIPVLAGDYKSNEGVVHDKSQSGATFYIEPTATVTTNNKLRRLQQDERIEIDRILREITALVGAASADLESNLENYGLLDFVHAAAAFSLKIDGASPTVTDEAGVKLVEARHPLLVYAAEEKDSVIPLSIGLDNENQGILVTGPNTGGKTVALKTIGLLTLMTMSGLEISADKKSCLGIYQKIYADIGDEQSLELSLSTYSSHIRNIIAALDDADENSLILFDEIGAGTDPKEGAALAEVIIKHLLARGCHMIVTTHYSQLKSLPLEHAGLVNASLEFDRVNLRPTFRLIIGIPGSSYAIEIARRLGLPSEMAEQAAELLGSDERSVERLIENLDTDLRQVHEEKKALKEKLAQVNILREQARLEKEKVEEEKRQIKKEFASQYEEQMRIGKRKIDSLIKEIRQSQASSKRVKEAHRMLEKEDHLISGLKKEVAPKQEEDFKELSPGESVWIEKFKTEGDVIEMVGPKRVKVAINGAFMTLDTIDCVRRGGDKGAKKSTGRTSYLNVTSSDDGFSPEIMLRGMTVDEALEKLEKFLDSAMLAGVGQVYVIHGKGTGKLRRKLSAFLKSHKSIASIRIGDWNEGGHGVTIARLKG